MGLLSKLFGPKADFGELLKNGASVIDVRTPGEFKQGHNKNSVNIPLDQIQNKLDKIKKMKQPVVLCCASGMRSGQATSILKQNGLEAYNAGPWTSLRKYQD